MLHLRRPKLFAIGIPTLLILFAMNHIEYYHRVKRIEFQGRQQSQIVVRAQGGDSGHNTIVIDDDSVQSGVDSTFLHFAMLEGWDFDTNSKSSCPESIKALSGLDVSCIGFMYPLESGSKVKMFCLLRTTQTCCYGPMPQYNRYIFVEMDHPVEFERLVPVLLKGRFFVDPQPDQGFIYRMEGRSLLPVGGDDALEINPENSASKANLPLFDFNLLKAFENSQSNSNSFSNDLVELNGKQIVLTGYIVDRTKDLPPHLLVSSRWWDGLYSGIPPTIFNSVMVFPKDMAQVPPLWKQRGLFTATLHLSRDPLQWSKEGIVSFHDATIGVPGAVAVKTVMDSGPYLPIYSESLIIISILMITLGKKTTAA